ncbi:hypothetical protein PCANB_001319 [Pneumocystis canis]|nr:hypothetical protein PCK1_001315 [Pneumocystis canis]KAG5437043.1 hypothetical protein PCANB_001319 [Pneumocystis canis]
MNYAEFDILATAISSLCSALAGPFNATIICRRAAEVLEANIAFQQLLEQLILHQNNILRIKTLNNETIMLNHQLDQYMHHLLEARKRLNETIDKDETFESTRTIPHTMLLNYAAKISKFSSAPDAYDPANGLYGNTPAYFPWPPEDAIRKGVLMAPQMQSDSFSSAPSTLLEKIEPPIFSNDQLPTQSTSLNKPQTNVFDGLDLYEPKDFDDINI